MVATCPGRDAARSGASQIRDLRRLGVRDDPGSAAHHFVLRRARETFDARAGLEKARPEMLSAVY
jgi:hypothetical protein